MIRRFRQIYFEDWGERDTTLDGGKSFGLLFNTETRSFVRRIRNL